MLPHFTARRTSVAIFRESGRRSSLGEGGVLYGIITEVRAEIMANASYPKDSHTIIIFFDQRPRPLPVHSSKFVL